MIRVFGHYVPRAFLSLVLIEFAILIAAFYIGVEIRFDFEENPNQLGEVSPLFPKAIAYALVMSGAMTALGLYSRDNRDDSWGTVVRILASLSAGLVALVLLFYLVPELFIGRGALGWTLLVSAGGIIAVRLIFQNFFDFERMKKRVLVLGDGDQAATINRLLRRKADRRSLSIVGFVRFSSGKPVVEDRIINHDKPLYELACAHRAETIVIAVDDRRGGMPVNEIVECRMRGIEVLDLLSFVERHSRKILLDGLSPSWLIFSDGFRYGTLRDIEKRIFDIGASVLLLLLTWPVMLITAVAIIAESGGRGPIFYRQRRVGEHGEVFDVLKFRSMRVDAEVDGAPQWASKNDNRVTRVGAIIRKFRIDEMPQFFNVLRGDMSFVGPRPERPEFVEQLSKKIPYYGERHRVKPGITGWAQICYPYGASDKDAEEKLQYDLYYVKNYTVFLDLIILLQTVQTVLWGRGAR